MAVGDDALNGVNHVLCSTQHAQHGSKREHSTQSINSIGVAVRNNVCRMVSIMFENETLKDLRVLKVGRVTWSESDMLR